MRMLQERQNANYMCFPVVKTAEKLERVVGRVRVKNMEYSPYMQDKNSAEFKEASSTFCAEVHYIYTHTSAVKIMICFLC